MSIKMNFLESEKLEDIDIKELYHEVLRQSIPYYDWPKWLNTTITKIYISKVTHSRPQKKIKTNIMNNPNTKREVSVSHFFSSFRLINSYYYNEQ